MKINNIGLNELKSYKINDDIVLTGWVDNIRKLGSINFILLRGQWGKIQILFDQKTSQKLEDKIKQIKNEYVISISGKVNERKEKSDNVIQNEVTDIEIQGNDIEILNTSETLPFMPNRGALPNESIRLKYRYLDIRRDYIKDKIITRSKITNSLRNFLSSNNFLDIETPFLGKSTPEGARDYLVPSRIHKRHFYALPQSPQIYKQLLMIGGINRYFQFAKAFRDEDLRADRQPEFTQLDMEMNFVNDPEQVMQISEQMIARLFKDVLNVEVQTPFKRLTYKKAMEKYGTDKPDLRYGLEIEDFSRVFKDSNFKIFSNTLKKGGYVKGIFLKQKANKTPRKYLDKLEDLVKLHGAKGLAYIKQTEDGEIKGSLSKFLSEEEINNLRKNYNFEKNDVLFLISNIDWKKTLEPLGALRVELAKHFDLIPSNKYVFSWTTRFPMFEYSEEEKRYYSMHHPFTSPEEHDIEKLDKD
ncbi:MAG: aspartate--tRNA ligase, partial [Candidatus Woesearchaeota archaeon]